MNRFLCSVLAIVAFLLAPSAYGQIDVKDSYDNHQPIVVTAEGEADVYIWKVDGKARRITVDGGKAIHVWAPPGKYEVSLVTITILIDWEEQSKDIQYNEYVELFEVKGGGEPDPDPDPTPQGLKQIMMFYDGDQLDDLPRQQRQLLTSLVYRDELVKEGHVFLEVLESNVIKTSGVPEKYKAWVDQVVGDPLPRIALAPKDGGKIVDYPLPADWPALQLLVGK